MRLTQKQIGFSLDIIQEIPPGQAYMTQYKVRTMGAANACASRLLKSAKIQAYLEKLRQKMEDEAIAGPIERRQILTEIARGDLLDYQETGADGGYLNIGKESPNTKAIKEITSRTEYDKEGAGAALVTTVKLHDPIRAVDILNKMDKVYSDTPVSFQDNRVVNIIVFSEKAKELTEGVEGFGIFNKRRELPETPQ
jgi:phage terminase small subunit